MRMRVAVRDLVAATGGRLIIPATAAAPEAITGVTSDSRTVRPGDLFVALRGPRTDGHLFISDAVARGAALCLVSDPAGLQGPVLVVPEPLRAMGEVAALYRRTLGITVVGITGSVGKTTTVGLCAEVLGVRYRTARSAESWNAELGVALTLLGLESTHQVAVVEMAMRGPGQIRDLVAMTQPSIGAVTTVGETHLELLGSVENIAAAKAELLEGLPPDGAAVVNADEPQTPRLVRDVRCPVIRFGLAPHADVRATAVEPGEGGTRFILHVGSHRAEAHIPLPGRHQVRNALAAAAVGQALGLGLPEIVDGLSRVRAARMRQEILPVGDVLIVDDSYNASPQSMAAAFEVLGHVAGQRRRILALGEMRELGPGSAEFHRRVGEWAAGLTPALLLAVGPDARWYLEGAVSAGLPASAAAWAGGAQEAVPALLEAVRPGDVVLIKGSRAIEMEHIVEALRRGLLVSQP